MVESIRKMWRIPELRKKVVYTFLMLVLYRLVSVIPAPGVDISKVNNERWVLHPTSTPALLCSC